MISREVITRAKNGTDVKKVYGKPKNAEFYDGVERFGIYIEKEFGLIINAETGALIIPQIDAKGQVEIRLPKSHNSELVNLPRTILEITTGMVPRAANIVAHHINGDGWDNRPSNLIWSSFRVIAEETLMRTARPRLAKSEILALRWLHDYMRRNGFVTDYVALGMIYGVSASTAYNIVKNKTWKVYTTSVQRIGKMGIVDEATAIMAVHCYEECREKRRNFKRHYQDIYNALFNEATTPPPLFA